MLPSLAMNLLLVEPTNFIAGNRVRISDRRLQHVLKVGILDDLMGQGTIIRLNKEAIEQELTFDQQPPPQLPLALLSRATLRKRFKPFFEDEAACADRQQTRR
ncbi:MAG: hypothetical protein V7707_19865 [Motiliproteus sp.]